jgi:hypothetical protein
MHVLLKKFDAITLMNYCDVVRFTPFYYTDLDRYLILRRNMQSYFGFPNIYNASFPIFNI